MENLAKFTQSPLGEPFEKQIKAIEDQGKKQTKALEDLKLTGQINSYNCI